MIVVFKKEKWTKVDWFFVEKMIELNCEDVLKGMSDFFLDL